MQRCAKWKKCGEKQEQQKLEAKVHGPHCMQFHLGSVYDLLPSPTNLHQCSLTENLNFDLCGKKGTLEHILSSWNVSFTQGRYRWRHDQVLRVLADIIEKERKKKRTTVNIRTLWRMTIQQQSRNPQNRGPSWIQQLHWTMTGISRRYSQSLWPDIVLWSHEGKMIIMVELRVPWVERCEKAYQGKKLKYQEWQTTYAAKDGMHRFSQWFSLQRITSPFYLEKIYFRQI